MRRACRRRKGRLVSVAPPSTWPGLRRGSRLRGRRSVRCAVLSPRSQRFTVGGRPFGIVATQSLSACRGTSGPPWDTPRRQPEGSGAFLSAARAGQASARFPELARAR
jgi:hypothetical protein